jgi:hypothetical protein
MAADTDIGRGESPQVGTRAVVLIVAGIFAALVLVAFGLELVFHDRIGITSVASHSFPAPAVIPGEKAQRLEIEARQRRLLDGGDGRMPIAAAMAAIAAKGERAFDPVEARP